MICYPPCAGIFVSAVEVGKRALGSRRLKKSDNKQSHFPTLYRIDSPFF
jgi:hypothetical protein